MDDLNFKTITFGMPAEFSLDCLEATLENSTGATVMSNEDVKLALLHLKAIVRGQNEMIQTLATEVLELKKTSIRNPLKK